MTSKNAARPRFNNRGQQAAKYRITIFLNSQKTNTMKTKILLIIGCFSISLWAGAQSMNLSLLAVAGEVSHTTSMSIQWTVGETSVDYHNTTNGILTEGFIQPTTEVIEIPSFILNDGNATAGNDVQINIWPNPVQDFLNIEMKGQSEENYSLNLFDINGKQLLSQNFDPYLKKHQLNLNATSEGTYLLQISQTERSHIRSFLIIKQ